MKERDGALDSRASRVRVLVLRAPGVNCDRETAHAFTRCGADTAVLHVNRLLDDRAPLDGADILCIPGGFSYGDDLGAGKIFGNKLALKLRGSVLRLVDRGGLVLGICNGFQVLVRAGILPGTRGVFEQEASLARNLSSKFESRWTRCLATTDRTPFLERGEVLDLPVAHGEGRFVAASKDVLERMRENGQFALVYRRPQAGEHPGVSGQSVASGAAEYPWNPAGSTLDIAGITDPTGQVLGLMPHPERHQDAWQRPGYAREPRTFGEAEAGGGAGAVIKFGANRVTGKAEAAGLLIFRRAVDHVARGSRLRGALA